MWVRDKCRNSPAFSRHRLSTRNLTIREMLSSLSIDRTSPQSGLAPPLKPLNLNPYYRCRFRFPRPPQLCVPGFFQYILP